MKSQVEISEDNFLKITYGVLCACFVVLFGFAAWMTSVELNASNLEDNVEHIQAQQDDVQKVLQSIDKRLYRIEMLLDNLKKEN